MFISESGRSRMPLIDNEKNTPSLVPYVAMVQIGVPRVMANISIYKLKTAMEQRHLWPYCSF